jgi:hypothetical protein
LTSTTDITGTFACKQLGLTRSGAQTLTATGATVTLTNLVRDAGISVKTIIGGTFINAGVYSTIVNNNFSVSGSTASPANSLAVIPDYTDGGGNTGWLFANHLDASIQAVTSTASTAANPSTLTAGASVQAVTALSNALANPATMAASALIQAVTALSTAAANPATMTADAMIQAVTALCTSLANPATMTADANIQAVTALATAMANAGYCLVISKWNITATLPERVINIDLE